MTEPSQDSASKESVALNDATVPRVRLTPEERVPLILDAAMYEFARRGFTGTRMDDIAQRCGLSKGGLYAHFKSKDAIFEALLDRTLQRIDWGQMPQLAAGASARELAEWIVDRLYHVLLTHESVVMLRLIIPEREYVPERNAQFVDRMLRLRGAQVEELVGQNLAAANKRDNVLARHSWLVLSPLMHTLLWRALFGDGAAPGPDFRQAHVDMICALLG